MPARRKHPGRGIQQRRETGRRYLRIFGWAALFANCALLVLLAERYFGGMLAGNGFRYAAGIFAGFIISAILIRAARSG